MLRTHAFLGSAFALTLCASAAWPLSTDDEAARAIARDIRQGEKDWNRAQTFRNSSSRIEVLDTSIKRLERARNFASNHPGHDFLTLRYDAEFDLVRALDDEAEIFYVRRSLPKAAEKVGEALDIDPQNPRSLRLAAKIESAQNSNDYQYGAGGDRMRGRRPMTQPTVTPRY